MALPPKVTEEIGPWPGEEPPAAWREPASVRREYDAILAKKESHDRQR